jgi:hypothetical protein
MPFGISAPKISMPSLPSLPKGGIGSVAAAAAASGLDPEKLKAQATAKAKEEAEKAKAAAQAKAGQAATEAKKKAEEAAAGLKEKAEKEAAAAALGITDPKQKAALSAGLKFSGGLSSVTERITTFFKVTLPAFFTASWIWANTNRKYIIIFFVVIAAILAGRWWLNNQKAKSADTTQARGNEQKAAALSAVTSGGAKKEGFQVTVAAGTPPAPPSDSERIFVNTQPLSIKHAGFQGMTAQGTAKFDSVQATGDALKAGFRAFVLQIDYMDTKKDQKLFPEPGVPTLLYRDRTGALLSSNAGSIKQVAETIAGLAFRPEVPNYNMPVILYLHVVRAPSAVKEPELHMRFLSRIATELAPIAQFHLGMTPSGSFHRQKQEGALLGMSMKALEGQVVILSNADTSMFRSEAAREGGMRYNPRDDLDYWVNMRVYLENDDTSIGITKVIDKGDPAAIVVNFGEVVGLSQSKSDSFGMKGKSRFVIAVPQPNTNPTVAQLDKAITELGINMVPLDIFTPTVEESKRLVESFNNDPYKIKPAALRRIQA